MKPVYREIGFSSDMARGLACGLAFAVALLLTASPLHLGDESEGRSQAAPRPRPSVGPVAVDCPSSTSVFPITGGFRRSMRPASRSRRKNAHAASASCWRAWPSIRRPFCARTSIRSSWCVGFGFSGIEAGGTYYRRTLFIANDGVRLGYTDPYLESTLHHELSSVLMNRHEHLFPAEAWRRANPPGFAYLGSGVESIRSGRASLEPEEELLRRGFLHRYSKSTLEDDFNAVATRLFMNDREFWEWYELYPRLRRKVSLAIRFFQSIHPALDQDYFRSL